MNNKIIFNNKTFTDANLVGGVNYIKDFAPDGEYCLGGAFCSSLDFSIRDDGQTNYKEYLNKSFRWEWYPRDAVIPAEGAKTYTSIFTDGYDTTLANAVTATADNRIFTTNEYNEKLANLMTSHSNCYISLLISESLTTDYTDSSGEPILYKIGSYTGSVLILESSVTYTGQIYGYRAYWQTNSGINIEDATILDGLTDKGITPKTSYVTITVTKGTTSINLIEGKEILSYSKDGEITVEGGVKLLLTPDDSLAAVAYDNLTNQVVYNDIVIPRNPIKINDFNRGNFVVKEITRDAHASKYNFKCYDKIILLDKPVVMTSLGLPDTIPNVIKKIETACGVTIQDCSNEFMMNDTIDFNFTGQFTYRNLLHWIGEYTGHYFFGSKYKADGTDIYFMKIFNWNTTSISHYDKDKFTVQATYGEIPVQPIDKLQVQSTFDDIGYVAGTGENAMVITGNPLFYTNSKTNDMQLHCQDLFRAMLKESYYTATLPMLSDKVTSQGKESIIDCGQYYQIEYGIGDIQKFRILRETINSKGVVFESVGSPTRDQVSLSTDPNIIALNNKTNELVRDVNETKSTITTVTTKMDDITKEQSEIKQTSNEISSTVTRLEGKVDKNTGDITTLNQTTSEIKQTADGLTSTVTEVENKVDKNTGDITALNQTTSTLSQTAEEIRQEVSGKVDGDDVQSAITTNLNGLTLSYNNSGVSGDNSCYITLSKDGVSIGGVVQMTNVTADTISASNITAGTLNADDISVNNSFAVKVNDTIYGYIGAALGGDAQGNTTYGATLRSADGNSYVIVTNGGVRMQKGDTSIWVTDEGISYRINGGSVVPIGYAVFS